MGIRNIIPNYSKIPISTVEKYSKPKLYKELRDKFVRENYKLLGVVDTPFKSIEVYTS